MAEQPAEPDAAETVNPDVRELVDFAQSHRWHCLILAPDRNEDAQGLMILRPGPLPDSGVTVSLQIKTTPD